MINLYCKDTLLAIINDEDILIFSENNGTKAALSEILRTKMVEEYVDFSEVFSEIAQLLAGD